MHHLLLAGLSWNPAISGILTVFVGVVVLGGSIYLIVATNTGARLGLLITLAGLFGWLSILTMYWWISPPGIGPRGQDPTWKPVEVYIHEPGAGPAKTEVLDQLDMSKVPSAAQVLAEHPDGLANQIVGKAENQTLADVVALKNGDATTGADVLKQYYGLDSTLASQKEGANNLNGWKILTTSQAGEASATADAALGKDGAALFQDATEYKKVGAFDFNPEQTRAEACPAGESESGKNLLATDMLCRAQYRIRRTFQLWHPPHYQVIQVQQVLHQEAKPGEPPPIPKVDPSKPVISVVMIRDQGNVRAKPAYFFAICFSLFLVFVLILHYRDKTLMKNLEEAEKAKAEAKKT